MEAYRLMVALLFVSGTNYSESLVTASAESMKTSRGLSREPCTLASARRLSMMAFLVAITGGSECFVVELFYLVVLGL